jgi:glycine/D-amino acid oxidase-like deaminating enzyme
VVRSFEAHPVQRDLATESLRELRGDPVLRSWAWYAEAESLYVTTDPTVDTTVDTVAGPARLLSAAELTARGWSGLPEHARGVHEPAAGWVDPDALRRAMLTELRSHHRVRTDARDWDLGHGADGYDAVAVAAGAWTPGVLRRLGLRAGGLTTKTIQYAVYRTDRWRPPCFVDETTGLYGRPVGSHHLLLGVPTKAWDVAPEHATPDPLVEASALQLAALRFPALRIRGRSRVAVSTDCYHPEPYLALRPTTGLSTGPADGTGGPVFTFTGGSGGAAKTVLAASARAASALLTFDRPPTQLADGVRR